MNVLLNYQWVRLMISQVQSVKELQCVCMNVCMRDGVCVCVCVYFWVSVRYLKCECVLSVCVCVLVGRCGCQIFFSQHTLRLLGYQGGRYNVGIFPEFIAFYLMQTIRLPVCTFYNPPHHPPSMCKPMLHEWWWHNVIILSTAIHERLIEAYFYIFGHHSEQQWQHCA